MKVKDLSVVIRDHNGQHLTGLLLRAGVELLAEIHDIDTLRTEGGTYGRARICSTTFDLELKLSSNFFCHCSYSCFVESCESS